MASAALSIIRDEHRSLAAGLRGLEFLVRDIRDRGIEPDFELAPAPLGVGAPARPKG